MMNSKRLRLCACLLLCLVVAAVSGIGVCAAGTEPVYTNPETGCEALILDDDDLLTPAEEAQLVEYMTPITRFGNIVFWSTDEATFDEIEQAKEKRYELYGNDSSGIFAINMKMRKVTFQSDGRINTIVNASYARSVTDNVSGFASAGDYYRCAAECFTQINTLLEGNRIAEPLKYISYVVIALMLSFVIVVGIVFSKRFNPLTKENKDKARLQGSGSLFTAAPSVQKTGSETRGWVTFLWVVLRLALSGGGSSGGSSGGGGGSSGGGGSGGSSSF